MKYAGFWIRFLALVVDSIILNLFNLPIYFTFGFNNITLLTILSALTGFLYETLLTSSEYQATWGKRLLGLRVANIDGSRISYAKSVARYFGKMLSGLLLGFGYIMVAVTDRKQGLHDRLAGTIVLSLKSDVVIPYTATTLRSTSVSQSNVDKSSQSKRCWIMAGFDETGHVIKFRFSIDDQYFKESGLRIGRGEMDNDFVVSDSSVSRIHAKLISHGNYLVLEDLGSKNGTFVGDERILPGEGKKIHGDQEVRFGDVVFSIGKE